jgi:hypothetical protein
MKDPSKRPDMAHVLAHPFLTGAKAVRLTGQPAQYDVFLSYRVASDSEHVEALYDSLCGVGLRVWYDKKCLKPGASWAEGFVNGLIKSRIFVPILSRGAINNSSEIRMNFAMASEDSPCDNVLLEQRMALELAARDLTEAIYPIMFGDKDTKTGEHGEVLYTNYFAAGCHPKFTSDTIIHSVEDALDGHLNRACLGSPLLEGMSVAKTLQKICENQGCVVEGPIDGALSMACTDIQTLIRERKNTMAALSAGRIHGRLVNTGIWLRRSYDLLSMKL